MADEDEIMTMSEAARRLGISRTAIVYAVRDGRLAHSVVTDPFGGSRVAITSAQLSEFKATRRPKKQPKKNRRRH